MASMSASSAQNHPLSLSIGHHEDKRPYAVTDEIVRLFQDDHGFDMLTAPITNDAFHSKVLSELSKIAESQQNISHINLDKYFAKHIASSLTPEDTSVMPSSTIPQLVLTTSSWIDLESPDPLIAEVSLHILSLEVQYAAFCGASNIMITGPKALEGHYLPETSSRYAHAIQAALRLGVFAQILLILPMSGGDSAGNNDDPENLSRFARQSFKSHLIPGGGPGQDAFDAWDAWNAIRNQCKYNPRLSVALNIPRNLPSAALQSRWFAEPLRVILIPGSAFYQNNRGELTLSRQQKRLILWYMRLRDSPWIFLSQVGNINVPIFSSRNATMSETISTLQTQQIDPTPAEASRKQLHTNLDNAQINSYLQYMRQLQHSLPPRSTIEMFAGGFQDYLQSPLQPLSDNLESITYETFEKDPVKYDLYEQAMCLALQDWKSRALKTSGPGCRLVLAVVGAGRGPLIERALRASERTAVEIDLWAVEKNPNAFVLLQRHNHQRWNQKVNLVQSDMRSWTGPFFDAEDCRGTYHSKDRSNTVRFHVDILVSELLGSFGDNELSPECIDGVQGLLNPDNGISIPRSYSAHLTPISAPKLHADILARTATGDTQASQVPYVVMLQAIDHLSTTVVPKQSDSSKEQADTAAPSGPDPCVLMTWEFSHPLPSKWIKELSPKASTARNDHNRRYSRLSFHCHNRGVCHGLAGYFEAVLYNPVNTQSSQSMPSNNRTHLPENKTNLGLNLNQTPKVELSTNPLTAFEKSKDMISWFPIYFPLKTPLYFPDNSLLLVSIWRQTDSRMVWYEWMVESFMLLDMSPSGTQRVERLGASDLHSSSQNGCIL